MLNKALHRTNHSLALAFFVELGVSCYEIFMSKKVVMFEYEKETKNSVRYKEVPDEGTAPIMGTLYVQKWFAGDSKSIEITINKKD